MSVEIFKGETNRLYTEEEGLKFAAYIFSTYHRPSTTVLSTKLHSLGYSSKLNSQVNDAVQSRLQGGYHHLLLDETHFDRYGIGYT